VSTIDVLDPLSLAAALDCVRDFREGNENGCKGKFSEFKRRTLILRVASPGGHECPSPPNQLQASRDLLSQFKSSTQHFEGAATVGPAHPHGTSVPGSLHRFLSNCRLGLSSISGTGDILMGPICAPTCPAHMRGRCSR
jgi:hypothetical protein